MANEELISSIPARKRRWQRLVLRFIAIYLGIGFSISFLENFSAAATGGLSAFVWTGSLKGNAVLLFWWFIIPAITWPVDVSWALYHWLLS
ncbi:MAG: hypothetical protein AUH19_01430 [Verrucomicrobia bacterium 13_2_20CM_55_10]|nr:MAG: hypothetical protein AUH19_01430 [Verrucomicrobia bacterium 13_2_20CM_55_10]